MVKIVLENGVSKITDEEGAEFKNIVSADIVMRGGEVPKVTLKFINPIVALDADCEFIIRGLDDYPTEYLEELKAKIISELNERD